MINYLDYDKFEENAFSYTRQISIIKKDTLNFNLKFKRVKTNERISFPFKVNSKYEKQF